MIRSQNVITSTTWANKPSAYLTGQPVFISNAGTKGSHWFYDGTRWKPLNGSVILSTLDSASSSIGSTETIVQQYLMPAGLWQTGDRIRFEGYMEKSGTTDSGVWYVRIGTAGTTGDTAVMNGLTWAAAANRGASFFCDFRLDSATSVQQTTANFGVSASGSSPAAVTISSATSNALYLSIGIKSSGAADTVLYRDGFFQLIAKAN